MNIVAVEVKAWHKCRCRVVERTLTFVAILRLSGVAPEHFISLSEC